MVGMCLREGVRREEKDCLHKAGCGLFIYLKFLV
jgi:hypothetical protein